MRPQNTIETRLSAQVKNPIYVWNEFERQFGTIERKLEEI